MSNRGFYPKQSGLNERKKKFILQLLDYISDLYTATKLNVNECSPFICTNKHEIEDTTELKKSL